MSRVCIFFRITGALDETTNHKTKGLGFLVPGEFPFLKALLTEYRASLSRAKWHCGFLTAFWAGGMSFNTLSWRTTSARPFCFTCFAALRLIFELLFSKKELFSSGPDKLLTTIYTIEIFILEIHLLPSCVRCVLRFSYSSSRRSFLRFRLRASACFARRLSPGFR